MSRTRTVGRCGRGQALSPGMVSLVGLILLMVFTKGFQIAGDIPSVLLTTSKALSFPFALTKPLIPWNILWTLHFLYSAEID